MSPAINPPFAPRGKLGSRAPPQAPSPPSPPADPRATTPPSNGSCAVAASGVPIGAPPGFAASMVAKSSAANLGAGHRHSFGAFAPPSDPVLAYKPLPPRPLSTVGEYGPVHPSSTPSSVIPISIAPTTGQPISIPPDVLLHASNTAAVASTPPPNGPGVSTATTAQVVENYHGGQHYHHHHHHHHHHFHSSPSSTSLNGAFQTVSPPEESSPRTSFDVPRQAALQVMIPSRAADASSNNVGDHGIVSDGIPLSADSPFPLVSAPISPQSMVPGASGGNSRNSSMEFILHGQSPVAISSADPNVATSIAHSVSSQMVTSTASTVTVVNASPPSPVTLEPVSGSTSKSGSPSSSSESLPGQGDASHRHPGPSTRSPSLSTISLHSVGTSSPLARGSVDYHQPLTVGVGQPAPHFRRRSSSNQRSSLASLPLGASPTQHSPLIPQGPGSSPSLANATFGSSSRASAAPSNMTTSPSSANAAAQAAAAAVASYVLTRVDNAGNVTDQYIVGNCIGRGSFGAVFRAIHMESHHTVAIKRFALADRKQMESILKEVRKMESLDHPNVVKYLGYVQTDTDFNIILEYVENGSLASTLKHFGPLPERVVGSIVCKVLQGLVYLHDRGLKHLDLKAANILTTKDGCVKLSDFGVSQSSVDTSSDKFVGSAYWMAPEVITLEGTHTASDIWSLGCTIIELLTGLPPYFDLLAMSALYKIVEDGCPPFPEGISLQLKDFLSSCFRKDFKERATARALLEHVWMIPFVHMVGALSGLAIVGPPPVPARSDLAAVQQQQQQQVAHVLSAPNLTVDVSQLPQKAQVKRPAPPPPPSSATSPGPFTSAMINVSQASPVTPSPSPALSSSRAERLPEVPIHPARTPAPPRASMDATPSSMLMTGRPATSSRSVPTSPSNANPRQVKEFIPPVTLTPMAAIRQQSPAYISRTPPPEPTSTPSPLAVSASRAPTLKRSQSAGSSIAGSGTKLNRSPFLPPGTKDALQALMGSRPRTKSTESLPTSGSRSPPAANLSRHSSDHVLVAPRFFSPPPPPNAPLASSNDPSAALLSKSAPTKPGFVVPLTAPPPPVPPTSLARSLAHKWVKATFASVVLCANCKQHIRKGRVCHDCSTAVCKPCANGEDGRKGMVCNVSSFRYSMASVTSIQGTDSILGPQAASSTSPLLQHQQHLQQRAPARKTRAPLSSLVASADLAALSDSARMSTSPPSAEAQYSETTTPDGTLDKKPALKRSGLKMGLVSPGKRPSFLASSREDLSLAGGKGVEGRVSSARLEGGASRSVSPSATVERAHSASNGRPKAREDCVVM